MTKDGRLGLYAPSRGGLELVKETFLLILVLVFLNFSECSFRLNCDQVQQFPN